MDNSNVLALKYRPTKLADLIGQESVVTTITNAFKEDKLYQSFVFAGNFGCGKCVGGDTLLFSPSGFHRIDEIVTANGISDISLKVYDESGQQRASKGYSERDCVVRQITSENGYRIVATTEHPLRVMSTSGTIDWKKAGDINPEDFLVISRAEIQYKGQSPISDGLSRLAGYVVSEGHVTKNRVQISNSNKVVLDDIVSIVNAEFPHAQIAKYKDQRRDDLFTLAITGGKISDYFSELCNVNSGQKITPKFIRTGGKSAIRSFIQSYFEGDGGVDGQRISATSKSRRLLAEIQMFLLTFGIAAKLAPTWKSCKNCNWKKKRKYWRLSIFSRNMALFESKIGFISQNKQKQLSKVLLSVNGNTNTDVIPYISKEILKMKSTIPIKKSGAIIRNGKKVGKIRFTHNLRSAELTYPVLNKAIQYFEKISIIFPERHDLVEFIERLRKIKNDGYLYVRVKSIKEKKANVYDICKDGSDHSFIANGLINHNTSAARILAAMENCETGRTLEPCGKCKMCREIFSGTSTDVREINAASANGIDDIRNVEDFVSSHPLLARVKYCLFDECHAWSRQAAESALKVFEEPPEGVRFVLCTTDLHKLKATIQSRCMPFRFVKVPWQTIAEHLNNIAKKEGFAVEEAALKIASRLSDGSVRNSLRNLQLMVNYAGGANVTAEVAQRALGAIDDNHWYTLIDAIASMDASVGMKTIQKLLNQGQDIGQILDGLTEHLRTLMVLTSCTNTAGLIFLSEEEKKRYIDQTTRVSIDLVVEMISLLYEVNRGITFNVNPQVLMESFIIKSMRAHGDLQRAKLAKQAAK
jgi:DNA polymerase III subunit gamma/tau